MNRVTVSPPEKNIIAQLHLGGSKSISNRLLILREVLQLDFTLNNLSDSEDTQLLIKVLDQLKLGKDHVFNVNHAGTDFRFLTAFLATRPGGTYTLSGSERLKERPIAELVNALKQLGAEIGYIEKEEHPPLRIIGKSLKGGKVQVRAGISSQFITALLLTSPSLLDGLEIDLEGEAVSQPYIRMSLEILKAFGLEYTSDHNRIQVFPFRQKKGHASSFSVESDWSSASYWFSVCALSQNAKIQLGHFEKNSLQADACLPELYDAFGVHSDFEDNILALTHKASKVKEFEYDFSSCPDIAPTVACTCLGLGIKAHLTGLKTLQLKESRRIDVLKTELQKFGATINTGTDFLELIPSTQKTKESILINTHNDHRMAMAFAPLSLVYPGLAIESPEVVNKSYPQFWGDLQSLGFRLNLQS